MCLVLLFKRLDTEEEVSVLVEFKSSCLRSDVSAGGGEAEKEAKIYVVNKYEAH
jgi:hypothetical protein